MSIYGNIASSRNPFTETAFLDYLYESNQFIDRLFRQEVAIFEADETSTGLTVVNIPSEKKEEKVEEVKKTIFQRIKEAISKFIEMVKAGFEKVIESLKQFFVDKKFLDNIISRYKDVVTWENMQKAREKGWNGILTNFPCIGKFFSINDSNIYNNIYKISGKETPKESMLTFDPEPYYNKIWDANTLNTAKETYNEFKEKLDVLATAGKIESVDSFLSNKNEKGHMFVDDAPFVISKDLHDAKNKKGEPETYYYPDAKMFNRTKAIAETGRSLLTQIRKRSEQMIGDMKNDKRLKLKDMKSSRKKLYSNEEESMNDYYQIQLLSYRAQYEFSAVYLKVHAKLIKIVQQLFAMQSRQAILTYLAIYKGIKPFVA